MPEPYAQRSCNYRDNPPRNGTARRAKGDQFLLQSWRVASKACQQLLNAASKACQQQVNADSKACQQLVNLFISATKLARDRID